MHQSVLNYCFSQIKQNMIEGKKVIELGSRDVCGSAQSFVKDFKPASYIGIDIEEGPGVDMILYGEDLLTKFEANSIDFILNNECMEHVENWKKIISNLKTVLKPGGYLLITTRSKGFAYHAWPYDFWRYEISDFKQIFSDMEIMDLRKDPECPGVFILVKKPEDFKEKNLTDFKLFSIVKWRRLNSLTSSQISSWDIKKNIAYFSCRFFLANLFPQKLKHSIKSLLYSTKR